jgi:hypothetical protein
VTQLSTLAPATSFRLELRHSALYGTLLSVGRGSATVRLADGTVTHWCTEAEVETISQEELEMAKKNGKTKVARIKKERTYVAYEVAAKDGAKLLDSENTSQAAVMYRALAKAEGPLTIAQTYEACKGKCESEAEYGRLGKNLNSALFALRKAGYIKRATLKAVATTA